VKKHFKKILATLLILVVVAFGFVGNYFYNFGLNPKVDKGAIVNQDSDGSKEDKTVLNKWFDETKQVTEMESVTKNKLVGYKFVNPNAKKWIFVVHGYTSDAKKMANYIKKFYDMGYSVFAPDLIAHGNSEGDFISMGGYDSDDLVNWMKKISAENNNADLGTFDAVIRNIVAPNGVKEVLVPSWSLVNGQDDLVWHKASRQSDGSYRVTIKASEHKGTKGNYRADAYIVDTSNNRHYIAEKV